MAVMPRRYREAMSAIRSADLVVQKGGGYLHADGSLRKVVFLLRALWPLLIARRLGKRRALLGHSVGPVRGFLASNLLRLALHGASLIVRDEASMAVSARLRLCATRLPDLGLLTRFQAREASSTARPGLTDVGVTAKRVSGNPDQQSRYLDALTDALVALEGAEHEKGGKMVVRLIPQVTGPTDREDDRPVLEELRQRLESNDRFASEVRVESSFSSMDDAGCRYGQLDFLLATRMHSAVLAACSGTPFCLFGYIGGKAEGLVRDLELPSWVTTTRVEELPEVAKRCYQSRLELRGTLVVGLEKARERLLQGLDRQCDRIAAGDGCPRNGTARRNEARR